MERLKLMRNTHIDYYLRGPNCIDSSINLHRANIELEF